MALHPIPNVHNTPRHNPLPPLRAAKKTCHHYSEIAAVEFRNLYCLRILKLSSLPVVVCVSSGVLTLVSTQTASVFNSFSRECKFATVDASRFFCFFPVAFNSLPPLIKKWDDVQVTFQNYHPSWIRPLLCVCVAAFIGTIFAFLFDDLQVDFHDVFSKISWHFFFSLLSKVSWFWKTGIFFCRSDVEEVPKVLYCWILQYLRIPSYLHVCAKAGS